MALVQKNNTGPSSPALLLLFAARTEEARHCLEHTVPIWEGEGRDNDMSCSQQCIAEIRVPLIASNGPTVLPRQQFSGDGARRKSGIPTDKEKDEIVPSSKSS